MTVFFQRMIGWKYCFFFLLFLTADLSAQSEVNPFEIGARVVQPDTAKEQGRQNPFDIVPETAPTASEAEQIEAPIPIINTEAIPEVDSYGQFLFAVMITVLLLMAFLFILFRAFVARSYRAFINDNILSQLLRDQGFIPSLPYLLFYLLFFINIGFFLFLFCKYFGIQVAATDFMSLATLSGALLALFIAKHLVLAIIEGIFPAQKEIRRYNFTIIIFTIILGMVLVPFNLLVAYGPEEMLPTLFWIVFGVIGLFYLYRTLRGIFIANRFLALHQFHFLLYICTVEIAPVVVIVKIIKDYL